MIETAKMSERGQIIIPKDIREEIGASTNTLFAVSALDKDTIVMKRINTKKLSQNLGSFDSRPKRFHQKPSRRRSMESEKPRVVLDTNVIVSAAVSREGNPAQIFELLLSKRISTIIKPEIFESIVNDPIDNEVILCALSVNASGDNHLLRLHKYKEVNILNPRQFLIKLEGFQK